MSNFVSLHIGADLGKQNDYTAVCLLQKRTPMDARSRPNGHSIYEVLTLKRFPLQTSYVSIIKQISDRLRHPPFDALQDNFGSVYSVKIPTSLAFDKTGVGIAVAEMLKNDRFLDSRLEKLLAVNITGGSEARETDSGINIPKRDLVMSTLIAFEKGHLQFASDLPELDLLKSELQNFEMKFTSKGNDTYSAKGTNHDDLVLALSLAVWSAKNSVDWSNEREVLANALNYRGKRRLAL